MAKSYATSGRPLYNHRGRTGRLTLVPTPKATGGYANCDTFGEACRVLEAVFDDDVVSIGTQPLVPNPKDPNSRGTHLDIREIHRAGSAHFIEVRDARLLTLGAAVRLSDAGRNLLERGSTFELVLRDEVVQRVKAKALPFLLRYRSDWQPPESRRLRIAELCSTDLCQARSLWLGTFRREGLSPATFYWALARGLLEVAGPSGLFPDGDVRGCRQ